MTGARLSSAQKQLVKHTPRNSALSRGTTDMETIVIFLLIGIVFVMTYAIIGLMDDVRVRENAIQWLYDNGHMTDDAATQIAIMIECSEE